MLAYATFKFIETPFRKQSSGFFKKLPKWYIWSTLGLSFFIGYGLYGHYNFKETPVNNIELSTTWGNDVQQYKCLLQGLDQEAHAAECFSDRHDVVVWGDSHAASLSPGLRTVFEEANIGFTQLTQSGCGPLANLDELNHRKNCNTVNENVLTQIIETRFNNIVLHAAWFHEDYPINLEDLSIHLNPFISDIQSQVPSANIIIVGAVPRWWRDPRFHKVSSEVDEFLFSRSAFIMTDVNRVLRQYSRENGITFIDPTEVYCPDYAASGECILALKSANFESWLGVTIDYGHLSSDSSLLLANAVKEKIVMLRN